MTDIKLKIDDAYESAIREAYSEMVDEKMLSFRVAGYSRAETAQLAGQLTGDDIDLALCVKRLLDVQCELRDRAEHNAKWGK